MCAQAHVLNRLLCWNAVFGQGTGDTWLLRLFYDWGKQYRQIWLTKHHFNFRNLFSDSIAFLHQVVGMFCVPNPSVNKIDKFKFRIPKRKHLNSYFRLLPQRIARPRIHAFRVNKYRLPLRNVCPSSGNSISHIYSNSRRKQKTGERSHRPSMHVCQTKLNKCEWHLLKLGLGANFEWNYNGNLCQKLEYVVTIPIRIRANSFGFTLSTNMPTMQTITVSGVPTIFSPVRPLIDLNPTKK